MRQMPLSLNFFVCVWEAKYWMKKKFGDLSIEEIQEITDNAIPVSTKKH